MNGDTAVLGGIASVLRGRWWLLGCYLVLGAVLGLGAAVVVTPGFRSSGSVLLRGPLSEQELRTQTLIATSSVVLDRTAAAFDGVRAEELRERVSAEVLDGNVIGISVVAAEPERAQRLTERVMREYVAYSAELVRRARGGLGRLLRDIRRRLDRIEARIGALTPGGSVRPGSALARLRGALVDTTTTVNELIDENGGVAFGTARAVVLEPAGLPEERGTPTRTQLVLGFAALALLLGTSGHVLAERRNRGPHGVDEIAAALNATVLATLDAPVPDVTRRSGRLRPFPRSLARRIPVSGGDRSRPVGSLPDREVRYRRVLQRLREREDGSRRIQVVVPDGDEAAHRLVARLAVTAGTDGSRATVVTDDSWFAGLVRDALRDDDTRGVRLTIVPSADPLPGGPRTVLEVVRHGSERTTIPENSRCRDVVVVFTPGTRSAWELVGISAACAEAGHEVTGILLARAVSAAARPGGSESEESGRLDSVNGGTKAATS